MRRLYQVVLIVLTISFSAFLIERSCHEDTGDYAPDKSGGISQAIQPTTEKQSASASVPNTPASQDSSEETIDKDASSAKQYVLPATPTPSKEPSAVSAVASTNTPRPEIASPEVAITPAPGTSARSAANTRSAAKDKLQGTWVLTDGTTRFELTVVNDRGVLKANVFEAGRSVTFEEKVYVIPGNDTIYVYSSNLRLPSYGITTDRLRDEPIVLAFNFNADGSPQVKWRRGGGDSFTPLSVVSRVKD